MSDTRQQARDAYDECKTHGEIVDWIQRAIVAEKALNDLFQACSHLCLDDMNKLEPEINAASNALKGGDK